MAKIWAFLHARPSKGQAIGLQQESPLNGMASRFCHEVQPAPPQVFGHGLQGVIFDKFACCIIDHSRRSH
jgi:hypothetical protein